MGSSKYAKKTTTVPTKIFHHYRDNNSEYFVKISRFSDLPHGHGMANAMALAMSIAMALAMTREFAIAMALAMAMAMARTGGRAGGRT